MRKSDLKNGMVVETRSGVRYLVCGDKIISDKNFLYIYTFEDDLINMFDYKELNIVKVYAVVNTLDKVKTTTKLLWERKEEKEPYKFNERQLEVLAPFDWIKDMTHASLYARHIMGVRTNNDLTLERTSMIEPKQLKQYKPKVLPSKIIFNEVKGKTVLLFGNGDPYEVYSATCEKGTTFSEVTGFVTAYYKYIHRNMHKEQLRQRIDSLYKRLEKEHVEEHMTSIFVEHALNNGYNFKQIDVLENVILGIDVVGSKTSITIKGQTIKFEYIKKGEIK